MDFNKLTGIEYREVRNCRHADEPARAVVASRPFSTGRQRLWNAFTSIEAIPKWFLPVSGDLEPGGRYSLEGNADGTIIRCEPPETLELTWEFGGNVSWLNLKVGGTEANSSLMLEHLMSRDESSEEHWQKFGPGATGVGWDLCFLGLAMYIDYGGEAIDRDASNAWLASESGHQFIRNSADAWLNAHVKSGEAARRARKMADRTFSAYTGT